MLELKVPEPRSGASSRDVRVEAGFLIGKAQRAPEARPARFDAKLGALPESHAARWPAKVPSSFVVAGLESGHGRMRRRVLSVLRKAARAGVPFETLKAHAAPLFRAAQGPGFVAWVRGVVGDAAEPADVRRVAAYGLIDRVDEEVVCFERDEASSDATAKKPPTPAFEPPVRDPVDDVQAFITSADCGARALITSLERLIRAEPARRGEVVGALEAVIQQAFKSGGEAHLRVLYDACAALTVLDRARAVAFADAMQGDDTGSGLADLGALLVDFPEVGALSLSLDALGIPVALEHEGGDPARALSILDELVRRGRAVVFGVETGHVPVPHDLLLYRLARLAPGLEEARFEQRAPSLGEGDVEGREGEERRGEEGPKARETYELRAWLGGERWSMRAENAGDLYDVEGCVAFVNALLEGIGSDWRLASVAPADQVARIVAGPRAALGALHDEGLLLLLAREDEDLGSVRAIFAGMRVIAGLDGNDAGRGA